jgi:hypothetical protein
MSFVQFMQRMLSMLKSPPVIGGIGTLILTFVIFFAEGGGKNMNPWYIVGFVIGSGLIIYGLVRGSVVSLPETGLIKAIKKDLVNMNVIERNTATKIASQIDLPPTTILQIGKDYERLLGEFWGKVVNIVLNKDYNAWVEYFNTAGQILDMHRVGLKLALIDNEEYKAAKLDLEQKRLHLKPEKRHRFTQANIVSVEHLSYGVNSHIILRGILAKPADYVEVIPMEIRRELEEAENTSETILKIMLDDLEGDWTKEKKK